MIHYLAMGTILGLSAGFAPGPLLALVLSETLQHGIRSGIKMALAPIITDLPIILLTLFVLSRLAGFHTVMGIISLLGGCFILHAGAACIRATGRQADPGETPPRPLVKGILANTLSPHPFLFWFSVGGPIMTRAMTESVLAAAAFVGSFYVLLVGSKILLALVAGHSKAFLQGRAYRNTMGVIGLALCGLALILFKDGLSLLGVL